MLSRLKALPILQPFLSVGDRSLRGEGRYDALTNWLAAVLIAVTLLYIAGYTVAGEPGPLLATSALCLVGVAALWLNGRGFRYAARHLLLGSCNAGIFAFALWLGPASGVHLVFFVMMANAVLIFSPQDKKHIAIAQTQAFAMILILHFVTGPVAIFGHLPSGTLIAASSLASIVLTATLLMVTLFFFSKAIVGSERMADEALGRLDREMSLVRLLQDVAIIANNAVELDKAVQAAMERILGLSGWRLGRLVAFDERAWRACSFKRELAELSRSTWQGVSSSSGWCDECRAALAEPTDILIAVPVAVAREVSGMMLFVTAGPAAPTTEMLSYLDNIGRQLGIVEERRRAQRSVSESHMKMIAAAKMATLGEMAGGIAHEINNPLSVIQGYLARIRKFQGWPDAKERVEDAIDNINGTILRITKIVNGLRAFARDSTNDPFEDAYVLRIVQDTLALSAERFRSKGVQLDVAPVPAGLAVECRASQISQVVMNLLNNAMDAVLESPSRTGRRVWIGARDDGQWVEIVVSDNGPGIPDRLREKVMQPFFTTKPVGQGTGLGLSISKGIIESHNGSLEFSSRPGQTDFLMRLPKAQAPA